MTCTACVLLTDSGLSRPKLLYFMSGVYAKMSGILLVLSGVHRGARISQIVSVLKCCWTGACYVIPFTPLYACADRNNQSISK